MQAIVSLRFTSALFSFADAFYPSRSRLGRTVVIKDVACVTYVPSLEKYHSLLTFLRFRAVLMYLYTREIKFKTPDGFGARFGCSSGVSPSSAKSVYRLADKVLC